MQAGQLAPAPLLTLINSRLIIPLCSGGAGLRGSVAGEQKQQHSFNVGMIVSNCVPIIKLKKGCNYAATTEINNIWNKTPLHFLQTS